MTKRFLTALMLLTFVLTACSTTQAENTPTTQVLIEEKVEATDVIEATKVPETKADIHPQLEEDSIDLDTADTPELETQSVHQAIAWYGKLISDGNDFQLYMNSETFSIHLQSDDAALNETIAELRDQDQYAHYWGQVECGAQIPDDCVLKVKKMRVDGPGEFYEPDVVESWQGTLHSIDREPGSGDSAYFLLDGDFPIQYGFWVDGGDDNPLTAELASFMDTGVLLEITGELHAGRPTWNGTQIVISEFNPLTE